MAEMTAVGKKKRLRTIADAFPPDFLPKHGGNPARAEIALSAAPGQLRQTGRNAESVNCLAVLSRANHLQHIWLLCSMRIMQLP